MPAATFGRHGTPNGPMPRLLDDATRMGPQPYWWGRPGPIALIIFVLFVGGIV